jgi:hypothetical protein
MADYTTYSRSNATNSYFKPIPVSGNGGDVISSPVFKSGSNSTGSIGVGQDGLGNLPVSDSGFSFGDGLGAAQVGLGALEAFQGFQNYNLQKKALNASIENANRNYEAEKTKYNNAVARTEAVNKHFGSANVASKI